MNNDSTIAYVASCDSKTGGIYQYRVDDKIRLIKHYPLDRPMYLAVTASRLYAVLLQPFSDSRDSGVLSFNREYDGSLTGATGIRSTQGREGCHVLAEGDDVYIAHYDSGSVMKLPDTIFQHSGHSVHAERQTAAHPHQCVFTPDGQYVCAIDLGLDSILVYDRALRKVSEVKTPAGSGPRHMVFSSCGSYAYCANELDNTVSVFSYTGGRLQYLHSVDALTDERGKSSAMAAIRLSADGRKLYVSNRGDDSISRFSAKGDKLALEDITDCGGHFPRDFCLLPGDRMLVTNERGNNISLFDKDMSLLDRIEGIQAPLCVLW